MGVLQTRFHNFYAFAFPSPHSTFLSFFLLNGKDFFFLLFCFSQSKQNMRQQHQGLMLVPDFSHGADKVGKRNCKWKNGKSLVKMPKGLRQWWDQVVSYHQCMWIGEHQ